MQLIVPTNPVSQGEEDIEMARDFDVIVYGASGFTGRLVAEYLNNTYGDSVKWAMAGRSVEKLTAVRAEMGIPDSIPVIAADANDPDSLTALCNQTEVVLTTVGPYQLYGEPLVAACVETGTAYVDLCGEPVWMRQMIEKYDAKAKETGARIVFSCGFDSIPFDMGVWFLQSHVIEKTGAPASRIRGRVRKMKGTFSGGTAASLKATLAAAAVDPEVLTHLRSPFALTPGFQGADQPRGTKPLEDDLIGMWCAPFIMAPINTKNVHRSNMLLGHAYGSDFVYDEMLITGPGDKGKEIAMAVASDNSLASDDGPKPGEGPSKEEREAGLYDVLFLAETSDGKIFKAGVTGDKDPGYGSTSKMITESALCLTQEAAETEAGFLTPAKAFGGAIIDRLVKRAGLTFEIED